MLLRSDLILVNQLTVSSKETGNLYLWAGSKYAIKHSIETHFLSRLPETHLLPFCALAYRCSTICWHEFDCPLRMSVFLLLFFPLKKKHPHPVGKQHCASKHHRAGMNREWCLHNFNFAASCIRLFMVKAIRNGKRKDSEEKELKKVFSLRLYMRHFFKSILNKLNKKTLEWS